MIKKNWTLLTAIGKKYGTMTAFANIMKISRQLVSGVVNGRDNIGEAEEKRWAKALTVKVKDIFPKG